MHTDQPVKPISPASPTSSRPAAVTYAAWLLMLAHIVSMLPGFLFTSVNLPDFVSNPVSLSRISHQLIGIALFILPAILLAVHVFLLLMLLHLHPWARRYAMLTTRVVIGTVLLTMFALLLTHPPLLMLVWFLFYPGLPGLGYLFAARYLRRVLTLPYVRAAFGEVKKADNHV